MLLAEGMPEPIGIRLADVLTRLGLTTGAAYNIWDSQSHFREDLILHMATHLSPPAADDTPGDVATFDYDGRDEVSSVAAMLVSCVRRIQAAPDHSLDYYVATIREPSAELTEAIITAQQRSLARTTSVVRSWMDHFERQPVAPHTAETLAVLVRNAIEGLLLRNRFEPKVVDLDSDSAPVQALAQALVALSVPR